MRNLAPMLKSQPDGRSVPRFARQVMVFVLSMVGGHIAAAVLQLGVPTETTSSAAAYDIAQRTLAKRVASPKILYVSGSSGFYSVRADAIVKALGRECVNAGLHAGLGAEYLLNRAASMLSNDDICVLGLEYELFAENRPGEFLCDYLMSRDNAYFYSLGPVGCVDVVLAAGPARIWAGVLAGMTPGLRAETGRWSANLSSRGDRINTSRRALEGSGTVAACAPFNVSSFTSVSSRAATAIDRFLADCRQKRVRVFATYPPLCIDGPAPQADVARLRGQFESFWRSHGVVVVGVPNESIYSCADAFDTQYHLGEEAAYRHTARLAGRLLGAMAQSDASVSGPRKRGEATP